MTTYNWKGIQHNALSEGEIQAEDLEDAKRKLKDMQVIITDLTAGQDDADNTTKTKKKSTFKYRASKIKNKHLMIFTKKFGTMVEAGLPMLKTLQMLEDQEDNPHLKQVIQDINKQVESGTTLSDAFARHPKVFDTIYINLLRSGETSGKLTFFLKRLTLQLEKSEKIRSKVKGALMYPIILLVVAFSVILIMLIKVVPVFQQMFASMGHDLPALTMMIVNASEFFRDPMRGGVLIAAIIAAIIAFRQVMKRSYPFRYKIHGYLLKMPIAKEVIIKSTLAKIAMIEGNLSAAGVSVLEALDIIGDSLTHTHYKEALGTIKKGVSEGKPLSTQYEMYPKLFPPTFSQMIAVGEETGNMDEMFNSVAHYYEEEFDMVVDRLTEMLEPFMIVFMGAIIGFLIVAMYLPIFQIGQTVSQ